MSATLKASPAKATARVHELRALGLDEINEALATAVTADSGALLTAWQACRVLSKPLESEESPIVGVTVPDFLNYARLLSTGQAKTVIELGGGLVSAGLAGLSAAPSLALSPGRAAKQDFWLIAETLLRFDLSLLGKVPHAARPKGRLPVLLHSYLTDFALLFGRKDFLTTFFSVATAAGFAPGIHTQQVPLALSSMARWGLGKQCQWLSFLLSPGVGGGDDAAALRAALASDGATGAAISFPKLRVMAEIEGLPRDLQRQQRAQELLAAALPGVRVDAVLIARHLDESVVHEELPPSVPDEA